MGDFQPGVARMAREGTAVVHQAYPIDPVSGAKVSIAEIARRIHDGRNDKDVRGWAGDVLIAAGRPTSTRSVAQAILNAFRKQTIYAPDPIGTEMINSAAATLCLRPGLCVRARDCDDGVVAVGSALASLGYEIRVIKQTWMGQQEHVLLAVRDETDQWLPLDPAHDTSAVGYKTPADHEEWTDPMMNASPVLVGVGALRRETHWDGRHWWERKGGQWMIYLGNQWRATPGITPASQSGSGGVKWCTICWVNEYGEKQCTQVACGTSSRWPALRAGLGLRFVYGDFVRDELARINVEWANLYNDVYACSVQLQNDQTTLAAFFNDYHAWLAFFREHSDVSTLGFGLGSILDEAEQYELKLFQWQEKFKAKCTISAPITQPTPEVNKPLIPKLMDDETAKQASKLGTVLAVALVAAGSIYALTLVAPAIRTAVDTVSKPKPRPRTAERR